jgi:hypothetical protein
VELIRHIPLLIVTVAMLAFPIAASANEDHHAGNHSAHLHSGNHTTTTASVIADPTVAPSVAVGAGTSSLAAGTYTVGYAWRANGGTTLLSSTAALTLAAGQTIAVTLPTFPTGVSSADIYLSVAPNNLTLAFAANTASGMTTISVLPQSDAVAPPTVNTTGTGAVNGHGRDDDNELDMETDDDHSNSNDNHSNSHDSNVQQHHGDSDHHNGGDD